MSLRNGAASHRPNDAKTTEMLEFAMSCAMRPTGAACRRDLHGDYSRCTLINTAAASNTPIASMLMAIWPSIMLSNVHTTIVDPISIGMARVPFGDPGVECGGWKPGGLTEPAKQRCNGPGK